jgi:uncharacterized RDD family membrane protein YckC
LVVWIELEMNSSETVNAQGTIVKAKILNRVIARSVDLLITGALLEVIPVAGYFAGLLYILIADGLFEGRSIGKKIIGLRVLLVETSAVCTYKESIIRNAPLAVGFLLYGVLRVIPFLGWVLAAVITVLIIALEGLILVGNDKGMRFGDEIARTIVVDA